MWVYGALTGFKSVFALTKKLEYNSCDEVFSTGKGEFWSLGGK